MSYVHEAEMGNVYANELDRAAEILQRVHPIGKVKALGRLEVVAALQELFPADEPVTEEWLRASFAKPNAKPNPNKLIAFLETGIERLDNDAFWYLEFNARKVDWSVMLSRQKEQGQHLGTWFCATVATRGDVRRLAKALAIELKEKS